jgi:hypothetical protein
MTPEEIAGTLSQIFNIAEIQAIAPGSWQVDTGNFRLLVLLSEDQTWLRILLPIVPIAQAQPFLAQFLEANFDDTQEVRYALFDGVVWAVYHHNRETLVSEDFTNAIARIISLAEAGLDDVFSRLIENRLRQIIQTAKQQGQTLQATMQNLERFYAEGLLGEIDQTSEAREQILAIWQRQLQRLWNEIEIKSVNSEQ